MSTSTKKIIGGVVGGVGGALLVGGIALVAWRMWGRKQHNRVNQDDDDMLDSQNDSIRREKASGSGTSPFRSNLDQYHNPGGTVNTASNF